MNTKTLPKLPKTIPCPHKVFETWPDVYVLRVSGDCMAPEICHLDYIFVSPSAPLSVGDIAALLTKSGSRGVKRLLSCPDPSYLGKPMHPDSNVEPVLVVEMNNPKRTGTINMEKLAEVHKVVHVEKGEATQ